MSAEPFIFEDLSGPEREPDEEERAWLAGIAHDTDPTGLVVSLGRSAATEEPGPIVEPTLDGSWRAGRYIGEIRRDGRVLVITPRLGMPTIAAWVGAILNVRVVPKSAEHRGISALISQLMAVAWRAAFVDAARDGLPGLRSPRQHTGGQIRGRLDLRATVPLRAARRPAVVSTSRPKNLDNPVARIIVLADRQLDRRLGSSNWRCDRVEELMPRLRGAVGENPAMPSSRELDRVRYTPITQRYRRLAELSWQIAHNRGLRARATAERAEGMLIDVAELWELFLVHCARSAFGAANVTHGTRADRARALLRARDYPNRVMGRLYPDLIIGPREEPRAILDAKYKRLADPRGVDREDYYQLAAYLSAHRSARRLLPGVLGYPAFDDVVRSRAEEVGEWRTWGGDPVLFRRFSVQEDECVAQIRAALSALHATPAIA